jgi:hypothetical protein
MMADECTALLAASDLERWVGLSCGDNLADFAVPQWTG